MKQQIIAFIFARGGSKGVPRKNIRLLAGKPLIAYSIETARSSKLIDRVVVSTDDEEIAKVAKHFGAEVPFMRPTELAQDHSPEWMAWQHAIRSVPNVGIFVSVPPTSPFRSVEDLDNCIQTLLSSEETDIVISVTPSERNPYFNMVVREADGRSKLVISPTGSVFRRQDAPPVFDMTTAVYAARPEFVLTHESIFSGSVKSILLPKERALDIDTELDFKFAEFLFSQQ